MFSERKRIGGVRMALAALTVAIGVSSCKPMDDGLVFVMGKLHGGETSMRNQPSFDPYENTRLPANGAMPFASGNYTPRPGSINVGHPEPMEYDLPSFDQTELDAIAARMVNPVAPTAESLARGKVLFERNCAPCHGMQGVSADAAMNKPEALPMMIAYNLAGPMSPTGMRADGYIYGMIRVGRGLMPPYGHQVSHFDRWNIVNYVRQLQRAAGTPGQTAPTAPGGN